jgi:hypothetical protein
MSQSLLCDAPNAKSSCFASTCLYTHTKLLMSSTIVFDVDGQSLVSMSIISDDHLQSYCTISMPVSTIHACLPAPLCWFTHDCVWCWWSATIVLIHALAHHLQNHKTISTLVERIPHLHHTQAQSVCGCAYIPCFVPTGTGYQCTPLPGPVTQ